MALEFRSVIRPQAFDGVLDFGSSPAETMVGLEIPQPVTLFGTGVRLGHPSAVVCKCEEVAFPSKANGVDWSDEVCVHKLIRPFGSTLRLAAVDLGRLGPLKAVTDRILGVINVSDFQVSEEGFQRGEVGVA